MAVSDPIVVRWHDGHASLGYLGGHRWRLGHGADLYESATTDGVVEALLAIVFAEVAPGHEARARPQLTLEGPGGAIEFVARDKFVNGWGWKAATAAGDVGPPDALRRFVRAEIARQAEEAWASGIAPTPSPPLDTRFALDGLRRATDPAAWCADLGAALLARARTHPSQRVGLDLAVAELGRMGHPLRRWSSWEWCTPEAARPPGLAITVTEDDDDQLELTVEPTDLPR